MWLAKWYQISYIFVMLSQVAEAKITEKKINEARESYRPAAVRASLLYFILNDLHKINPLYQFSLKVQYTYIHNRPLHIQTDLPFSDVPIICYRSSTDTFVFSSIRRLVWCSTRL